MSKKKALKKEKNGALKSEIADGKRKLDGIFKGLKKGKSNSVSAKDVKGESKDKLGRKDKKGKSQEYSTVPLEGKGRPTIDNLPVYTMEELNIGKGGDTELCPFDCDCCF
ncbi:conserved hypothetical protein [Theileria equi strain WA]|uniref:DUF1764 domain-containing protein n=1 Tax=Theileria equi strain WA TaxID=1537102 RepID=L1LA41_THEEQ|nr:conserved hypothetical protein [Theileria equi strain WA]EKX72119.1 conserved hypothetical protein [Theileria equi strain WA]|eukprot:XP_004831571.1 conserved hypothetical protein [Theileria equi strain WA]